MTIQGLGYAGFGSDALDDWRQFGTELVGLQAVERGNSQLSFRMDDRKQRIVIDRAMGEGARFFGWEVADAAGLDTLAARLEQAGVAVKAEPGTLADERRVKDLIVLSDPVGNRVEIFHGAEVAGDAFKPGRNISGFRTGALGLGHVVLHVERFEDVMEFYRDLLGFRVSDYFLRPYPVYFFHVNPRHHSLAFAATGKNAVHHMMLELYSLDDVGQGYDLANAEDGRLAVSLGRHCGDWVTSFYTWTPSAFMVEYGWGARSIDVDSWQPSERKEGPSLWGHDRAWLAPELRQEAQDMRIANAQAGLRRPVQVIDGNYDVMTGVCPWFDSVKSRQSA